ncbi:uncharacterized protein LOC143019369 [Oratosquilla oratoria]|uniref:uncharacterized protein LOC143019369 n=1 Tax=Oratosquilla oratoria TaxID=337810 RepID=UPI003F758D61
MSNKTRALKSFLFRLDKDEDLKAEYNKVFDEYESMGIIEEVPSEEMLQPKPIYYLPHRPVVKLSCSTTKFLQLSVNSQDENILRYFMPGKDGMKHMRFIRIILGDTSSPFILNATIKHHLSKYPDCEVVQDLKRDMYVDNWFSGADTVEVASKYSTAYDIMADANMSLEKLSVVINSKFREKMQIVRDGEVNTVLGLWRSNDTSLW